jgi:hypothetical protein
MNEMSLKKFLSLTMNTLQYLPETEKNRLFFLTPLGIISGEVSSEDDLPVKGVSRSSIESSAEITHKMLDMAPGFMERVQAQSPDTEFTPNEFIVLKDVSITNIDQSQIRKIGCLVLFTEHVLGLFLGPDPVFPQAADP